jgi:hypothetical protein
MKYTEEALAEARKVRVVKTDKHALIIIGTIENETGRRIIWMDPDPRKTKLGTKNRTPLQEFVKLQGKSDWVAVTVAVRSTSNPSTTS